MSQIQRKYNFLDGQVLSEFHLDDEFNNLVNANNSLDTEVINHKAKQADTTSTDTVKDKHDSNSQVKKWEDHGNNTSNPHGTTASQVGAYSKSETDGKFETIINVNNHKNDKNNPHAVTASQVGAYAKSESDGRYYTKTEIDSSTKDHKGTWRGLTPGEASEAINGARLDVVEAELNQANKQSVTLNQGTQTVSALENSPINVLSAKGRTLVNLLGKDGNCEDLSKWTPHGSSTISLDNADKVYGGNSLKSTATVTGGFGAKTVNKYSIDNTKNYILMGYFKNTDVDSVNIFAFKGSDGATVIKGSASLTTKGSYIICYVKISPTDLGTETSLIPYVRGGASATGQKFNVDGVRLYEISQSDYDKIGVSLTDQQVADMFPYVDSIAGTRNPAIINDTNSSYTYHNTTLYGMGAVSDELVGNKVKRMFEEVVLDGSLTPAFIADDSGYKIIAIPIKDIDLTLGLGGIVAFLQKYDGKILKRETSSLGTKGFDTFAIGDYTSSISGGEVVIAIADTDSGWGESYTPTADEIKAYFYGWKMRNQNDTNPYNGTGTKAWGTIASGGTSSTLNLPTTPALTLWVITNSYTNVQPCVRKLLNQSVRLPFQKVITP
jgi:hypothetical protein